MNVQWIGDIDVFDPILSGTESRVLEALGCSVLSVNEQALGHMNSMYQSFRSSTLVDSSRHILAVRKFTREFAIKTVSDDYFGAFHDSSWHFLEPCCLSSFALHKQD
ncbi:hypothetical protein CK203_059496 [Vitis vinifera]|uniref:Uncharacterized protein n=1 Tax=Vitis vinifera TaxID=29760 RepID=A0A438GJ44_VITVI|nr:hypothetical protein CK203_059496 [Vitis vinifera]